MNVQINSICNFNALPDNVQEEIKSADRIELYVFHIVHELKGYKNNKILFNMAGTHKITVRPETFEACSYGSDEYSWYPGGESE